MNQAACTAFVKKLAPLIETNILGGGKLTLWEQYSFSTAVKVDHDGTSVNATLWVDGDEFGAEVTDLMLSGFVPDGAIKFSIAHEIGHAYGGAALRRLCIDPKTVVLPNPNPKGVKVGDDEAMLSGAPTEVVADAGAAYVLNLTGMQWDQIVKIAETGLETGIFDPDWSGHHPPGAMRASCVQTFAQLMEGGCGFDMAAKAVCLSMVGKGPERKK